MLCDYVIFFAYVITSHHANLSKMHKHWGSFLTHCTSLGVKEDHSINQGNGPPVFRIQGELAHWSGTLLPEPGHSPVYAQLYIYDPSTAVGYRMANNNG